jgi:hypothetical protein
MDSTRKRKSQLAGAYLKLPRAQGSTDVRYAMKMAGFSSPEARDQTLRKGVYRERDKLPEDFVHRAFDPPIAAAPVAADAIPPPPILVVPSRVTCFSAAELCSKLPKGKRLTSGQAHSARQASALQKQYYAEKFKAACLAYKREVVTFDVAKARGQNYRK